MQAKKKNIVLRILKVTGITTGSILLLLFLLPMLFPGFVSDKIKQWANSAITTELNFSSARLSFFNHFPSLTLTLHDVSLMGSKPYATDTLLKADEVALGIDLSTVFSSKINIDEIYVTDADINIRVDDNGNPNYNVYRSDTTITTASTDSSGTALKIEKIKLEDCNLVYDDLSVPMLITAADLNYTGKGDLSKAVFDLSSDLSIKRFDFDYDFAHYLNSKTLKANLVTKINTNSLAFAFEKNDLLINSLPVDFTGRFEFLSNGYNMDFQVHSTKGDLHDVLSALPPEYNDWLKNTDADGKTIINFYLTGKYIPEENKMPDLGFNMTIRDGYLKYAKAPAPVKNIFLNFDSKLPSLNTDSLYVNIDSVFFNINQDYCSTIIKLNNLNQPTLHAKMNALLDLDLLDKAFGIQPFDLKGNYELHLNADGKYSTAVIHSGIRQTHTVITEVPKFSLQSSLKNGYFKYASLPKPVTDISFNLNVSNIDGDYKHTDIAIEQLNAHMLSDYIKGFFKLDHMNNVDADIHSVLHLGNIQQYYPLDSMQLNGDLNVNITSKGNYNSDTKNFPVTKADIQLENGFIQTAYYPHPVQKIAFIASLENNNGTLADTKFNLQPVSFEFEGQPFLLKADLQNFDDIRYNITSNGSIDIGKIYQVFSQKGLDVKGFIKTNLILDGLQSDAAAGRYNKLHNNGTAELKDIQLSSDYFPKPFFIQSGLFRFANDKMYVEHLKASYGKTFVTLNGYLSNIINYALQDNAPLEGNFNLATDYLLADEFMAFAPDSTTTTSDSAGVVLIPPNLNISFTASAKKIQYDSLIIDRFNGGVTLNNGKLTLNKTSFTLAGAPVTMDAHYNSTNTKSALFDYHITVDSFDIQRAYKAVPIFQQLATSAAYIKGIASLDYNIAGRLNANMQPVYPSLKGGGTISLQHAQVKGFKLLTAVSKATNKDSINNPDLKAVQIKTTIANNIITLEKTKLKIFGFRPRFEGQVSFDGRLNLSGRLGLPPLGIFGIPFSVTGTQDDPKVKLKRSREGDELEETPDDEDDSNE